MAKPNTTSRTTSHTKTRTKPGTPSLAGTEARTRTKTRTSTRTESDTFGPIEVPADRYWGAQTERSRQNFRIGSERMPIALVRALAVVKRVAAEVNHDLDLID